ncbi:MAG: peptidase M20 [Hyphomicrobiales bacterium]|nr:MAG: peptidase M20 [Hyphomicrobiales bacterium]
MKTVIEENFEREVAFLQELIRTPSDNPPGDCDEHAIMTAELLEELGFSVEHHPVPEPFVRQNGMKSVTNLIVRRVFGDGEGPTIALHAHGDAVPPGNGWSVDPYGAEITGDVIYGRGAVDAKSDFTAYVFALLAVARSGRALAGTVELHLTYDEELGGFVGPKWLLETGVTKPDLAICDGFSYNIINAHNGCLHLEVVVRGQQAHAAMPDTGADALEATTPILAALYEERKRISTRESAIAGIGTAKLTVGTISGGVHTNVVPDRVKLRIDRRMIPEEDGDVVEAELIALIENAAPAIEGVTVECRRLMLAEPLVPNPGAARLSETLRHHAQAVFGEEVVVGGAPLFTDARHYASAGIPTVLYGAGPKSLFATGSHSSDEHLKLGDLKAATEVVARTLVDLLSPKG